MEDKEFEWFVKRVKEHSSIDLSLYKEPQMKRRLKTLYSKKGFSSFVSFFEAMTKDRNLYREFLDRMTINVSEFWRNQSRWQVLEQKFLPELTARAVRLKCWSAACSTGEEPYTLAMILAEAGVLESSQLIATDIDEGALEKAARAVYADRSLREVPERYAAKYFKKQGETFAVVDSLKKHVKFAKHDLLNDPFESGFDLIVCRNVLIYFTEEAKRTLYHKFSRALKPGGLLFVGSTEQIFTPGQYELEPADMFFYRKK